MADEERARGVEEPQRLGHFVPGLKRVVDRLVVIQPGIAVPGDADEPSLAAEHVEAFEGFGMPSARTVGWHVVPMDQYNPAAIGLTVGQAFGLVDLLRSRDFFDHGGKPGIIARHAREVHVPVHRLDGHD